MPATSTNSPTAKLSTRTRSPGFVSDFVSSSGFSVFVLSFLCFAASSDSSRRNSPRKRMGATPAFLKWPVMALLTRCGLMNSTRPSCTASYPCLSFVRRSTTTQGPACSTVHGIDVPSSANTCVMPSLIPKIPLTAISLFLYVLNSRSLAKDESAENALLLRGVFAPEGLDFHVNSRREIELHQRVHRIRSRTQNIDQALVRAHLKLLARFFVHVRGAQHGPTIDDRGQGNRPRHFRARAPRRFDNLARGLIENAVIVSLQTNANFFSG